MIHHFFLYSVEKAFKKNVDQLSAIKVSVDFRNSIFVLSWSSSFVSEELFHTVENVINTQNVQKFQKKYNLLEEVNVILLV